VTMPLLMMAARTELRKLEKPVSEADFRLPEAVKARRETWPRLLAKQAEENHVAVEGIDYDRLAWLELGEETIATVVERSALRAKGANVPVTTDLLLKAVQDR